MFCPSCGKKVVSGQKFCTNCGHRLAQVKSSDRSNQKLFQKIAHDTLDLISTDGDKWRKNTELMPKDCWILFMYTAKAQAKLFLIQNNISESDISLDKLMKDYFNAHSAGLWVWVAEKKNTDPSIFNGGVKFDSDNAINHFEEFMTKWDGMLDHLDTLIQKDIEPSIAIAELKAFDVVARDKILNKHLTAVQIHHLKSDFKGAIYRGYLLHRFFK